MLQIICVIVNTGAEQMNRQTIRKNGKRWNGMIKECASCQHYKSYNRDNTVCVYYTGWCKLHEIQVNETEVCISYSRKEVKEYEEADSVADD